MYIPQDNVNHPLYVIAVLFNPVRFKRRWKLYRDFQLQVRNAGAILLTVEVALGDREFALEDHAPAWKHGSAANGFANAHNPPLHVDGIEPQYRSHGPASVPVSARMPNSREFQDYIKIRVKQNSEIWLKENLMNIAIQHLPDDAKYIAFVDADVHFTRPDWVSETLHQLQHYDVVQMFSVAQQMDSKYESISASYGYVYCHLNGAPRNSNQLAGYYYVPSERWKGLAGLWHTGFCWAWRKSAIEHVGGMIEHAILGAADNHMARALVGRAEESINPKLSEGYKKRVREWGRRADTHIKGNVGFVEGTIYHYYHGRIVNRRYNDRWRILLRHDFDPDHDLKKDSRGVICLTDTKPGLRDDIRSYFRARDEDSSDVYPDDGRLLGPAPGGITW